VRRLIVVNVLIFAVLASAVGLAYYGYSYTSEVSTRERAVIQDTMRELAEEKVAGIESLILDADQRLFDGIRFDDLAHLGQVIAATHPWLRSVVVVDDDTMTIVPDGYLVKGQPPGGGDVFRKLFETEIVHALPLRQQAFGVRGHTFGEWNGQRFLFSYVKLAWGDRIYHVVVEENWPDIMVRAFPQFLSARTPRLYQIVDDDGVTQFGVPFRDVAGGLVVEQRFAETFDKWTLRVAQKDTGASLARARRSAIDFVLIGISLVVILASLGFLAIAIRRERRANELKSEFISNVSHELKTPLSIISMFGEMLAAGRTKSPQQANEYADIIWRESVRLARLIDNVLDFAKIERGVDVYEFAEADAGEVVQRALELSVHRLQKAEMTVTAKIEPDLPPVRLDANAFTLAVLNLIDNAIKYASEGKKIEIELRRDEGALLLAVRDFGPGIAEDEHEAIFERFYRAKAVRLKPIRGSGIGLSLVQHIARAHGGDATVDSKPGRGATFTLWVPIEEAPAA
jgi:two-component system, OmpR family, phosphate regulon sensor histidine kinase PhoR